MKFNSIIFIRLFCILSILILGIQVYKTITEKNYGITTATVTDVYYVQDFGHGDDSAKNIYYRNVKYNINGIEYEVKEKIIFRFFQKKIKK